MLSGMWWAGKMEFSDGAITILSLLRAIAMFQEGHLPNAWTRAFSIRAATEATLFRGLVDAVLVRSLVERLVTCGKHIN